MPAPFVEKTFLSLLNFLVPLLGLFLDSLFCFIDLFTYPYIRPCFERNLAETASPLLIRKVIWWLREARKAADHAGSLRQMQIITGPGN